MRFTAGASPGAWSRMYRGAGRDSRVEGVCKRVMPGWTKAPELGKEERRWVRHGGEGTFRSRPSMNTKKHFQRTNMGVNRL